MTAPLSLTTHLTAATAHLTEAQTHHAARHMLGAFGRLNRAGCVDAGAWRAAVDAAVGAAVGAS